MKFALRLNPSFSWVLPMRLGDAETGSMRKCVLCLVQVEIRKTEAVSPDVGIYRNGDHDCHTRRLLRML